MIKEEYKDVVKTQRVLVSSKLYCDICNKEVKKCNVYFKLTTGHCDWGNDSYESIENYSVCSNECLSRMFNEYVDDNDSQTSYFQVERDTWIGKD